jgi:hypothetical protein
LLIIVSEPSAEVDSGVVVTVAVVWSFGGDLGVYFTSAPPFSSGALEHPVTVATAVAWLKWDRRTRIWGRRAACRCASQGARRFRSPPSDAE